MPESIESIDRRYRASADRSIRRRAQARYQQPGVDWAKVQNWLFIVGVVFVVLVVVWSLQQ